MSEQYLGQNADEARRRALGEGLLAHLAARDVIPPASAGAGAGYPHGAQLPATDRADGGREEAEPYATVYV